MTTLRGQRSASISQMDKRRPGESDPHTTKATVGGGKVYIRTGPPPDSGAPTFPHTLQPLMPYTGAQAQARPSPGSRLPEQS